MELNYFSHPNKLLGEHIANIEAFCSDELFRLAAHFHDLGKVSDSFQRYIRGESSSAQPHALASALAFVMEYYGKLDTKELFFVFNAIRSHHGALASKKYVADLLIDDTNIGVGKAIEQLREIYAKEDVRSYFALSRIDENLIEEFGFDVDECSFGLEEYINQKLLFSRLIFADKFEAITSAPFAPKPFSYPLENLYNFKKTLPKNEERAQAAKAIWRNYEANGAADIYTITAPTGIGKTLISLELALRIAKDRGKNRVIYTIPFTSIIDQTAAIFERIFPARITKHHHRVEFDFDEERYNDYDRIKYLVESWAEPFILSTFYQLFFALLSDANSDNIKFQSLSNAVIILDEVQAIPFELWKVLQPLFTLLAKKLGSVFVLMSATMPVITKDATELAPKEELFVTKNRYRLDWLALPLDDTQSKIETLAKYIAELAGEDKSVVCIVNTIKNSKLLYQVLSGLVDADKLFLLNSYMLPRDREASIKALCELNSNQVKGKILISTQVIEAGVDLDFDVGLRELAPLSSIIQTAGRVNREGKKEQATLYIFDTLGYEIYDSVLMDASRRYLVEKLRSGESIEERDILQHVEDFFAGLDLQLSDRYRIIENIEKFDFDKIAQSVRELFSEEASFTHSVVLGIDLKEEEGRYFEQAQLLDKWELKSYKERQLKALAPNILNIKEKDLQSLGINIPKSEIFGLYYIENIDGIYDPKRGFLIPEERELLNAFE